MPPVDSLVSYQPSNVYPYFVGFVVEILGIAFPNVAFTVPVCPPLPPFASKLIKYVAGFHLAYKVVFAVLSQFLALAPSAV